MITSSKQMLPNSTATLVLGILSIVFCWCYGIIGTTLGIIALAISSKSIKMYNENPFLYDGFGNLKAGRIMAIIGISLSAIYLVFIIIYISIIGLAALSLPNILDSLNI
ncbi:MAG: hypothetical protein JXB34_12550 [Bacteroidales bacterium]|nr:hypothetical protein [Bacteroidales bacterium]